MSTLGPRRQLEANVLDGLRAAFGCEDCASKAARGLAGFDAHDLVAASNAAIDLCLVAEGADGYEAMFGAGGAQRALEEARVTLSRVLDAGRRRCEERREGVAPQTRIRQDQLGRWTISRRPAARPDRLARPRARRSSPAHRRGSRRATGSGDRAGPGGDQPPGESNPGDVGPSHHRRGVAEGTTA